MKGIVPQRLDPSRFTVNFYGYGGLSLHHPLLDSFNESMRNSDILYVDLGSYGACELTSEEKKKGSGKSS